MRRIKAFFLALLLFAATAGGYHLYIQDKAEIDSEIFPMLASEEKGTLREALGVNMPEDGIPVFGSSEFQHGTNTVYHPANVFSNSDFHPMLIGAGYYQSLSHAVTLASIADSLPVRKAVLIVSPQWFRKTGVVHQAYASRFIETHYAAAMANDRISDETKQYFSDRTRQLLDVDEKTLQRVKLYDRVFWEKSASWSETAREEFWLSFLDEKELFETMLLGKSSALKRAERTAAELAVPADGGEPDWSALLELAEQEGEQENQNPFYMNDDYYKRLLPHLESKKDINADAVKGYQTGPEFEDLACFLQVCRELEIEPMLVIMPVNGYYYDYTGFPREAREAYYEKIRALAQEYGAETADFSDQEYTKYFFEDRVHLGKKGWVMVDESLYRFYKED